MHTLQEMVMHGKIRAPNKDLFLPDINSIYLDACVDEIFDMCITREGEGWIAVCRKDTHELYGLQFDFYNPCRGLSTMAINDYRRARATQQAEIIVQADEQSWEEEYRIGASVIKKDTEKMNLKYIVPELFDISDGQKRILRRNLLSEYTDGNTDVRIFFSMSLPKEPWNMSGKPEYNFVAYYDYPYVYQPFRIMSDDSDTHQQIMSILTGGQAGSYIWDANGIKIHLPGVFREVCWKLFNDEAVKSIRALEGISDIKAIVRERSLILYLVHYKELLYALTVTPSGFHRNCIDARSFPSMGALERAVLGTSHEYSGYHEEEWLCSNEEKENLVSDIVILKLGAE